MVIFIDESEIHKTKDHSCIALVYIEIHNLPEIEKAILAIESKLLFIGRATYGKLKENFLPKLPN